MGDQNSTVEQQFRPEELMTELGIKKQAYYDYLKHLGIKAEKDSNGRAYITQAQAKSVRLLRQHVVAGRKIEDFDIHKALESALAVAESTELSDVAEQLVEEASPTEGLDMEALYLEASEIAGQRLTAGQQLVMAMASQMGYEDLHPVTKAKVDQVRSAAVPKFDAQKVATDLLSQFRQKTQVA
ncbi:MAG: hypothetical protein AAGC93_17160 [Cyanobacteria bacterium P01_F01_bin.53]